MTTNTAMNATAGVPVVRKPWPLLGYAPGNYMCTCAQCGEPFTGDKRASMCLPCAAWHANLNLSALDTARAANEALMVERTSLIETKREQLDGMQRELDTARAEIERLKGRGGDWTTQREADAAVLRAVEAESAITAAQARIAELEGAARHILPYLKWTISDESCGHHPTMPSAVAAFEATISPAVKEPK